MHRTSGIHQRGHPNAGRTNGLAGLATETPVDVPAQPPAIVQQPFGQGLDQGHPTARGFSLVLTLAVGRAGGETQTTLDAAVGFGGDGTEDHGRSNGETRSVVPGATASYIIATCLGTAVER